MSDDYQGLGPNRQITFLGLRWWIWIIPVILLIGATAFAFNWLGAGTQIVSPENIREQFTQAYSRYESLEAQAETICQAQIDEANASPGTVRDQRTTQRITYEQNYRRIAAQYDSAYDNVFQAQRVGPSDLPNTAPTLGEMKQLVASQDVTSPCNESEASS